jgi:hypothetical protein
MSAETPGVKTQLNFKTSQGTLVNIYLYSYDEDEIKSALTAIANVTPEINAVETLYNAQGTLKLLLVQHLLNNQEHNQHLLMVLRLVSTVK